MRAAGPPGSINDVCAGSNGAWFGQEMIWQRRLCEQSADKGAQIKPPPKQCQHHLWLDPDGDVPRMHEKERESE